MSHLVPRIYKMTKPLRIESVAALLYLLSELNITKNPRIADSIFGMAYPYLDRLEKKGLHRTKLD